LGSGRARPVIGALKIFFRFPPTIAIRFDSQLSYFLGSMRRSCVVNGTACWGADPGIQLTHSKILSAALGSAFAFSLPAKTGGRNRVLGSALWPDRCRYSDRRT
jgi:hypothetical protein